MKKVTKDFLRKVDNPGALFRLLEPGDIFISEDDCYDYFCFVNKNRSLYGFSRSNCIEDDKWTEGLPPDCCRLIDMELGLSSDTVLLDFVLHTSFKAAKCWMRDTVEGTSISLPELVDDLATYNWSVVYRHEDADWESEGEPKDHTFVVKEKALNTDFYLTVK